MLIRHSSHAKSLSPHESAIVAGNMVDEARLRLLVEGLSRPRHFQQEADSNQQTAIFLAESLQEFGYQVRFQGPLANVVGTFPGNNTEPLLLIGAHYDSVPGTPGADDNASALAALLECARILAELQPGIPVGFVAFNCEEDGFLGSRDFVQNCLLKEELAVKEMHVLEMVGFCRQEPGSQRTPPGLPISLPETGNFLALIGNTTSNPVVDKLLCAAKTYVSALPVTGLKVYFGVEQSLPVLGRSDHEPFWKAGIPAVMWTDTAEFRNPHYHQRSDTPETLDYGFCGQ